MKTVFYLGGFILPDKNAAAQRVVSLSKILTKIGYKVVLIGINPESTFNTCQEINSDFPNVKMYEIGAPKNKIQWIRSSFSLKFLSKILNENEYPNLIFTYNYFSLAIIRLLLIFGRNKIVSDNTEFYFLTNNFSILKIIKFLDSITRLFLVNFLTKKTIYISKYLKKIGKNESIIIPPLIDPDDPKWKIPFDKKNLKNENIKFSYAGQIGDAKDNLKQIIKYLGNSGIQNLELDIIGVEKSKYINKYDNDIPEFVNFLGRLSHEQTLSKINASDYFIFLRDKNLVTKAGFPTKFVESLNIGTPVITNTYSDILEYESEGIVYIIDNFKSLNLNKKTKDKVREVKSFGKKYFDYRVYEKPLKNYLIG